MEIDEDIFRAYLSAIRQAADDVRKLRRELDAIGAIQTESGDWLYPFYGDGAGGSGSHAAEHPQYTEGALVMEIDEDIFRAYLSAIRQAADDVRKLRREFDAIGAIQTESGDWLYPFYMDGSDRYLPRETWIATRKAIGEHMKQVPTDRQKSEQIE